MTFLQTHSNVPVRATVINTGSELLLGKTLNTHGQYLAKALWPLGIELVRQVTLPDGEVIAEELRYALENSDVVIVTGGLGPTSDDITRDMVAGVLGVSMELDREVEQTIRDHMAVRGYAYTPNQSRQAMIPKGGEILDNPLGTAPGLYFGADILAEFACSVLAILPAPPRELIPMVEGVLIPRLKEAFAESMHLAELAVDFRLVGVGESVVATTIESDLAAIDGLRFGYCARNGEVDVRCVGTESLVARAREIVAGHFAEQLISEDGSTLVEQLLARMRGAGKTLATAESCTGGAIANMLTDVGGASEVFVGGFVTYSNEAKSRDLGVPAELIDAHGAVSPVVCEAMAAGCLARTGADFAVACTGIAGPGGGSEEKPTGTVFIGLAERGGAPLVTRHCFWTDRVTFKERVARTALEMVRQALLRR